MAVKQSIWKVAIENLVYFMRKFVTQPRTPGTLLTFCHLLSTLHTVTQPEKTSVSEGTADRTLDRTDVA